MPKATSVLHKDSAFDSYYLCLLGESRFTISSGFPGVANGFKLC